MPLELQQAAVAQSNDADKAVGQEAKQPSPRTVVAWMVLDDAGRAGEQQESFPQRPERAGPPRHRTRPRQVAPETRHVQCGRLRLLARLI
jgi:hypothetical protein